MADITIIRNGARISLANFPKLGSGSENIAVAVSASGAYDTYTTELYYGWYQGSSMQKMLAKYQNGLYYIPANALFNAGNVYLTLRLVSGGNKVSTNTIPITIEKSAVNNEYSILPATETWQKAVDYYINNSNSYLNKRLDNLVANTGNSNSEIVDARLGADGVTYDTLGTAIRKQYNSLNKDLSSIEIGGYISKSLNYTEGGYIDNKTGGLIQYNNWKYTDYIEINGNKISVSTTAPDSTLYNGFYNSEKTFIKPFNATSGEILDVPVSAKYVRMSCQSNYNQTLGAYTEGLENKLNDKQVREVYEDISNDIISLNKCIEPYIIQTSSSRNIHIDDSTKPKPLTFIHFSDIHAKQELWNRVIEFANHYKDYIPFAIHSGDYVGAHQGAYIDLYANGVTPEIPIYNVVGNHDTYLNTSGDMANKSVTYPLIFNHRNNWDVTSFMSGSNSMTYYKKFDNSNVWVFFLDNYYDQDTQVSWLRERLNNAKNAGAHVITIMHEVSRRIVNKLDTGFQTINDYESLGGNGGNAQGVERISPFDEVIAEFKANGGVHVANLVGHEHTDMIGYTSTGVLNIAVECATDDTVWSDARRVENTKTWDAFNVFSVNVNSGTFTIVRVGNNTDTYGRARNVFCYDYINKKIITTH